MRRSLHLIEVESIIATNNFSAHAKRFLSYRIESYTYQLYRCNKFWLLYDRYVTVKLQSPGSDP